MSLETLLKIIALIIIVPVIMFLYPLMTEADLQVTVTQAALQSTANEFIDDIRKTGVLTEDKYNSFIATISVDNAYDVELKFQILDENPAKKTAQSAGLVQIDGNSYYIEYTTQIVDRLSDENYGNQYNLKEGDIVSVSIKNEGPTFSQVLKNVFYGVSGNNTTSISVSSSGIVTKSGK